MSIDPEIQRRRRKALDELVRISQESGAYDDPPNPAPHNALAISLRHQDVARHIRRSDPPQDPLVWWMHVAQEGHADRGALLHIIKQLQRDAGNLATLLELGGSIAKVTEVLRLIESGKF